MMSFAPDNLNILIVDDTSANLKTLTAILSKRGYQVRPALNGELALNTARKKPPDLILLDIRMPGMDGYEVCRRLKEDQHTRDIPVIFISALDESMDKVKAFELGGVDYITKPFQSEEVLARVKTHIELRQMRLDLESLVTERTSKLQESENQIKLLLNSTAEAIYGLDMDGNCTFANRACIQMLGYKDTAELSGKNMHELIHHSYPDSTPYPIQECPIFQAFQKGKYIHVDDEVLWRADRTSFPAEYWSYPVIEDDQIKGAVVTFMDITERRQAEEELWQHRHRLEIKVRERTDELQTVVNLMAGRELRMAELKKVIEKLHAQIESEGLTPVAGDPLKGVDKDHT